MILKWLLLIAIVVAVWFGFKAIARRNRASQVDAARRRREAVEDMTPCPVCGTYIAAPDLKDCGRDRCPYGD